MAIRKYSYWWDNSHPDFAYQPQLPSSAGLVIVGAGFAGVSAALWALKLSANTSPKPPSIIILESAPHTGFKSSGRMNGSIYLGSNKPVSKLLDKVSPNNLKQLYTYSAKNNKLMADILPHLDCDFIMSGGLRMSLNDIDAKHLLATKEILDSWGFYNLDLTQDRTQALAITPLVKSSLFITNEGLFDPYKYLNFTIRLLRQQGVAVHYGARVVESETNKNGACVTLENGHKIQADGVIHTTPQTIPLQELKENIVYRRETVIRTHPLAEELDEMPLPLMPIELNNGLDSARIHDGSMIMTGGKSALRQNDPDMMLLDDSAGNRKILDCLDSTMMRNFPFSNHTDISHVWTYIEAESSDGLPIVGDIPAFAGHYVNIAHGRNKFGLAFLASKNLAEKALGLRIEEPEFDIFTPQRFTRGD